MSSSTTAKKVTARTKARQKIAAQREELIRRQKADEADLAEILKALDAQDGAADNRADALMLAKTQYEAAVAKAHADHDAAVAESEEELGRRLAAMRGRGQSVADLAVLTELSETDVRRHLKAHKDRQPDEAAPSDTSTPSPTPAPPAAEPSEALGGGGEQASENSGANLSVAAS